MLQIKLKLPRYQENFIKYVGDAGKFLNLPIVINETPVGVITGIISDSDDFVEVEGFLYKTGIDYFKNNNEITPASITILNR